MDSPCQWAGEEESTSYSPQHAGKAAIHPSSPALASSTPSLLVHQQKQFDSNTSTAIWLCQASSALLPRTAAVTLLPGFPERLLANALCHNKHPWQSRVSHTLRGEAQRLHQTCYTVPEDAPPGPGESCEQQCARGARHSTEQWLQ